MFLDFVLFERFYDKWRIVDSYLCNFCVNIFKITYMLFLQRQNSEQDNKFENILYDLYYLIKIVVVELPDFDAWLSWFDATANLLGRYWQG